MVLLAILQEPIYFYDNEKIDSAKIYYDSNLESFVRERNKEELEGLMMNEDIELFGEDDWVDENRVEKLSADKLVDMGMAIRDWNDKGVLLNIDEATQEYSQKKHHFPDRFNISQIKAIGILEKIIEEYTNHNRVYNGKSLKSRVEIEREEITCNPIFLVREKKKFFDDEFYKTIAVTLTREEGENYLKKERIKGMVFCHCAYGTLQDLLKKVCK